MSVLWTASNTTAFLYCHCFVSSLNVYLVSILDIFCLIYAEISWYLYIYIYVIMCCNVAYVDATYVIVASRIGLFINKT